MERAYKLTKIILFGTAKVGAWWKKSNSVGRNRLYYINGGIGGYLKKGEKIPFEKGKIYFMPYYANIMMYTDLDDPLDHTYIYFTLTPPILSSSVYCLDTGTSSYIRSAAETFCELCSSKKLPEFETELLKNIVIYFIDNMVSSWSQSIIKDNAIITALDIMHYSISKKLSVSEIAKECHMSTGGFIRKFTRNIGETPYSYLKNLKLRTAIALKADGATNDEAAAACGYSDAAALLHALATESIG